MTDINELRAAIRRTLIAEAEKIAMRNGSKLKATIQDYAYHAGMAQGMIQSADLLDDLFKQGNKI